MADLVIDLDDGLPPVTTQRMQTSKDVPIFRAPQSPKVLSVPVAIVILTNRCKCLSCGAEHQNHYGIFLESKVGPHALVRTRKTLRELPAYLALPRRIEELAMEAIPICQGCWHDDTKVQEAVAAAQVEAFPDDPAKPKMVGDIIDDLEKEDPTLLPQMANQ